MIDHDRLFKELLSTFFIEFIELFFPEVITYLEPNSITFLDKEVFTDVTAGERYEADLLVQAQFQEQFSCFLIHVENQSYSQADFNKRMFRYFARLHEKYDLPIYPVVVFSYAQPQKAAESNYQLFFPDFKVLEFNYQIVQLNQLNWRDFLNQRNPIASALMAKMQIAPEDRPRVKAECLRLLVTLRLNPAKMQLIAGFIDTYLNLAQDEEKLFQSQLTTMELEDQEQIMEITTSWEQKGIVKGQSITILRLLNRKLGNLPEVIATQIQYLEPAQLDTLTEDLLGFETLDDLNQWLNNSQGKK
jgi:predicted transposase/invertase (TIGR01784 family)